MTRPSYRLGLTGSIGMGKSTTAGFFAAAGVPVWDADAAVHQLYGPGMAGADEVARLAPEAVTCAGVDRELLREAVVSTPGLLAKIEARVHPLVTADRAAFAARHRGAPLVLFDIPLLYETGAETGLDGVLVVSARPEVQRARVLARGGMTEDAFAAIVARQTPDAEKRIRADFVIETDRGIDAARAATLDLVTRLTAEVQHA